MNHSVNAYQNILELRDTPLIKLNRTVRDFPVNTLPSLAFNPGHSNKDRIAYHIVKEAECWLIEKGSTIIETTSGNTGFSLAMVSMIKGYNCVLAVTSKSSQDKINMLSAMGAEVHVCLRMFQLMIMFLLRSSEG